MATTHSDAGRFDANSTADAARVLASVLDQPGSWCNLEFEPIEDEDAPAESPLFGFLAARGPANPLATVTAGTTGRRSTPTEVGIQHQAGVKAADQLREAGVGIPEGARVMQDHPRRGLVVRLLEPTEASVISDWLFAAMRELGRQRTTNNVLYTVSVRG